MTEVGITTLILIIANIFCSLQGLNQRIPFERNKFEIGNILLLKDYRRLITAGFFHVNATHLILNMATLCLFSGGMQVYLGEARYLLIYFTSLLGGHLFALFIYRHHKEYSAAAGASGAVCGVVFATIALLPGFEINILGKNLPVAGWFYSLLFVLFSMYGIRSGKFNIGHEVYLAGGLTGLIAGVVLRPASLENNYPAIFTIGVSAAFLIFMIVTRPNKLFIVNKFFNERKRGQQQENELDVEDINHEQQIDLILEKIHQNGIGSLTKTERTKLDHYSRILQ